MTASESALVIGDDGAFAPANDVRVTEWEKARAAAEKERIAAQQARIAEEKSRIEAAEQAKITTNTTVIADLIDHGQIRLLSEGSGNLFVTREAFTVLHGIGLEYAQRLQDGGHPKKSAFELVYKTDRHKFLVPYTCLEKLLGGPEYGGDETLSGLLKNAKLIDLTTFGEQLAAEKHSPGEAARIYQN